MTTLILTLATLLLRDEAALRESFSKDIQAKEAAARVAAVKKLAGAKEHKTIELLAGSLKDAELEVRKAAAETLEGVSDAGGAAVKPLGEVLVDKKQDLDLRLQCAKSLSKSPYKSEAFPHYLKTITSIEPEERQFHKFGFEVTQILDKYVGKSFGAGKTTGERWEEWWTDNKAALAQADSKRREAWKKTQ
jgi:hypothetical protein